MTASNISHGAAEDKASAFSWDLGGNDDKKYVVYKATPMSITAVAEPRCKAFLEIT